MRMRDLRGAILSKNVIRIRAYRKLAPVASGVHRVDALQYREGLVDLTLRHQKFRTLGIPGNHGGYGESWQTDGAQKHPPRIVADAVELEGYRQWYNGPCYSCESINRLIDEYLSISLYVILHLRSIICAR